MTERPERDDDRALLGPGDPPPVTTRAECAPQPFLIVSDHAGRRTPRVLGDLGVSAADWERHIAWDIGIRGVGEALAEDLGAGLIEQVYSRLVIDCNRAPGHPTSIPPRSDGTLIPANEGLAAEARAHREREILHPYHHEIAQALDARGGRPTAVIALHSFTPRMDGIDRPWEIGLLHNRDRRLTDAMFRILRAEPGLTVGDNQPYELTDGSDYTIPLHAEARGLPYLEVELRQDLIAEPAGQKLWAGRLAAWLRRAWEDVPEGRGAWQG